MSEWSSLKEQELRIFDSLLRSKALDMDTHRPLLQQTGLDVELRQYCMEGPAQEVDDLLTLADYNSPESVTDSEGNSFLHISCQGGQVDVVTLVITKYNCKVDGTNNNGQTPLHLACAGGHSDVVDLLISKHSANLKAKDKNNNEPLHIAAQNGHTSLIVTALISKYADCDPISRGQNGQTLLHLSLANGHKELAETLLNSFDGSLVSIDNDGNTPLHLTSLTGQEECVEMLLYKYNAPIFIRNKAGKTAQNLSQGKCRLIFKQYLDSPQSLQVQSTNEELYMMSSRKYSSQPITRVFVLGNVGSGKSTLIESFKHKGLLRSRSLVGEEVVAPRTSGIVPSHYDSKKVGRIIYYDFAGDREYYSSHSAIIEMVFQSQGNNLFCVVLNLCKDVKELEKELGYWLSFISYVYKQNTASRSKIGVLVICSHVDVLNTQEVNDKVDCLKELSTEFKKSNNLMRAMYIFRINCCLPQDVRTLKEVIQKETKDATPCCLSYGATLLHGMLEKDFSNFVACKLQVIIDHINNARIHLPSDANKLYPISRELQHAGLLLIIGQSEDRLEDHLLLMDVTSLTSEVHEKLFSKKAREKLKSLSARMGILPEKYLRDILPAHITKECLVQLQYCHEFSQIEVKLNDNSVIPRCSSSDRLLYFPDLCNLEIVCTGTLNRNSKHDLDFNIGWYAKCIGKFDYFPPRFLHVLLLRLAYSFALPIASSGIKEEYKRFSGIQKDNRRCTMWKNGICWMMDEGVECICEVVDDSKGIVVIARAKKSCEEVITILKQIIDKVLLTKVEYCEIISLQHFLLNSDDPSAYQNEDELYDINDVENAIEKGKRNVVSVIGTKLLDSSHLSMLRKYTYWGKYKQ